MLASNIINNRLKAFVYWRYKFMVKYIVALCLIYLLVLYIVALCSYFTEAKYVV